MLELFPKKVDEMNKILYFIIALVVGSAVSFFIGGVALAAIFFMIWLDKGIIGYGDILHKMGIEITTIAAVFLGILFGPVFAFFFAIISIVLAHGITALLFPDAPSEWPPFIPHPYNAIDAIGAVAASMTGISLFNTLLIVLLVKSALFLVFNMLALGKPPNFLGVLVNVVFNVLVFVPLAGLFIAVTGANLAL